ncbi:MAG TPA: acyltransferase, partial [Tepidisphaeraceae bacterium]|nr:acyltransferase [Tepidisphaeraceae bacterium]
MRIADGVGVGGRSMQLDVLRGLAILLVLFRHPVVPPGAAGHLRPLLGWTERFGWTGVDLFFVLSGFLIGGLLFAEIRDEGRLRLGRFLVRRALRIWPAYFAFLGFAVILSVEAHGGLWAGAKPLLPNLVHLQNYLGTPEIHTWSLAVEEHFYVVLPLVLLLLLRLNKLSWIPVLLLLVCFGCLGLRLANPNHSFSFETHLTPTHLRLDSLGFGVLLAYGHQFRPGVFSWVPRYRIPLLVVGIALLSPMLAIDIERRFVWTIGFTLTYLGYGCILIACLGAEHDVVGGALRSRTARLIAFVGFYSYSIYLWHVVVFRNLIHYSI